MAENSFYYDGSLCIACRSCQVACKQWNYLPGEKTKFFAAAGGYQNPSDLSPMTWTIIKFHEVEKGGKVDWFFRRHHCFHCTQAACIEACPYGVPHVDADLEKSRKCTGCVDRVMNGMIPACAKTCPTQAIRYGSKKEMYALAQKRVSEVKKLGFKDAQVYGTKQLGGLHSIYVLPGKLEVYGLDPNPSFGNLAPIQRKAQEAYAAWRRAHGDAKLASLTTSGGAVAAVGLAAAGLQKLTERKRANAEKES